MEQHEDPDEARDRGHGEGPGRGCAAIREALSADLDDEVVGISRAEVDRHLDVCGACARFAADVAVLARRSRVVAADAVPDLTDAITASVADAVGQHRRSEPAATDPGRTGVRARELRVLVALAGAVQLVLALPMLLGLVAPDLHLGRDLGALQVALGVGLLFAAAQPRRAQGVLPVVTVVAAITVVAAAVDVAVGVTTLAAELTHLTELVGVAALWTLSRRHPASVAPSTRPRTRLEPV